MCMHKKYGAEYSQINVILLANAQFQSAFTMRARVCVRVCCGSKIYRLSKGVFIPLIFSLAEHGLN